MPIKEFPSVDLADDDGLLAAGGDLAVESLLLAYRSGIFPWPLYPDVLTWFAPPERAVLFLEKFHVSTSLKKERRRSKFVFTIDRAFQSVIDHCRTVKNRRDSRGRRQRGTWITPEMLAAYTDLHQAGYAHSVECWDGSRLVGGIYGVAIGLMFAGESMFYLEPNASKLAFVYLVEHLRARGASWMDCQVVTPLTESFGAELITRKEFSQILSEAIRSRRKLFP